MRVRLVGDPTRIGFVTGRRRPSRTGTGERFQVKFADATSWIPEDQIEPLPADRENPIDLLQAGKLGRAVDLRRALTHVRLTGRLADVIYSMETTNTDFYSYQFKPVLRFLHSPSNALLIADEVGLGKTIEAGLIWTELRSRFDLRRLLVLCPAMLREKWERELADKIGVSADRVNATQLLRYLTAPEAAVRGYALICSLEGARPHRKWQDEKRSTSGAARLARFLRSQEHENPIIDLLVIDEAHYLRNPESRTNELGSLLRPVSDHVLFLTATPIHNYNQDLFALLQLLDGDTFERESDLRLILEASQPLVKARDLVLSPNLTVDGVANLLDRAEAHPLLAGSRQLELLRQQIEDPGRLADRDARADFARRIEMINPMAYVITRTRKRDVKEWRVIREPIAEKIPMTSVEEDFYETVTDFVIDYALTRDVNERFLLATPQRQMSSSMAATLRAWQQRRANIDDTAAASQERGQKARDEMGPLVREIIQRAPSFGDVDELVAHDSKYARLRSIFTAFFREHPDEKIVLFSTYRETLNYLGERLSEDGVENVVMHGGVSEPKERILRRFQTDRRVRVLLSSEIGSEGIDLQFASVVVNYDLPWNPMRIEQRIGRLDRLGQQAQKILIWNLFYDSTIDSRIYSRLYAKLDLCRQALGDFEAVLGDEIRDLTTDLLSGHLTPIQQEKRIDQTAQALANLREDQEQLESEAAHLVAYGDYILNQVRAARDMHRWITGADLRVYVIDFFKFHYPGCTFQQIDEHDDTFEVKLSAAAKQALEAFIRGRNLFTATRLTSSSSAPVKCRFENRTTIDAAFSVELLSQFHPLVRFVSAEISANEEQLSPAVSIRLCVDPEWEHAPKLGTYILAASRWSVTGLQSNERLVFAAASIDDDEPELLRRSEGEHLVKYCAKYGVDWPEASRILDMARATEIADQKLYGQLDLDFEEFVEDLRRQNEDRATLQARNLERHLGNQRRKYIAVREEHRRAGRDSLAKATDGRINALENRIERQRLSIESKRKISPRNDEVLVALVHVHDGS